MWEGEWLEPGKYSCPDHQEESVVLCAQLVRLVCIADHKDVFSAGLYRNQILLLL